MRLIGLLCLLWFACFMPNGHAGPSSGFTVTPQWHQGDKASYLLTKHGEKSEKNGRNITINNRTEVELEILSVSDRGYQIGLTQGPTRFEGQAASVNPVVQSLGNAMAGLQVRLDVDRMGSIERIENWRDVQQRSMAAFEQVFAQLKRQGLDSRSEQQMRDSFKAGLADEAHIRMSGGHEPGLLLALTGKALRVDSPVRYKFVSKNPFGGEGFFDGMGEFRIEQWDKENGRASVSMKRLIDTDVLASQISGMLRQHGGAAGAGVASGITFDESSQYSVDVESGWIHDCINTQVIAIGGVRRLEVTEIKLLELIQASSQNPDKAGGKLSPETANPSAIVPVKPAADGRISGGSLKQKSLKDVVYGNGGSGMFRCAYKGKNASAPCSVSTAREWIDHPDFVLWNGKPESAVVITIHWPDGDISRYTEIDSGEMLNLGNTKAGGFRRAGTEIETDWSRGFVIEKDGQDFVRLW